MCHFNRLSTFLAFWASKNVDGVRIAKISLFVSELKSGVENLLKSKRFKDDVTKVQAPKFFHIAQDIAMQYSNTYLNKLKHA